MRFKKEINLLAFSIILLFFLAINGPATASPNLPPPSNGLSITDDFDDSITGRFTLGSTFVDFEGTSHSPVSASASININGKLFTITRDLKAGTCTWNAGGATLLPEDRKVLLGLAKELSSTWINTAVNNKTTLSGHKDLVTRLTMLLAEAPLGVKLTAYDVPRPSENKLDERTDNSNGTPIVENCKVNVINTIDSVTEDQLIGVASCQQTDECIC